MNNISIAKSSSHSQAKQTANRHKHITKATESDLIYERYTDFLHLVDQNSSKIPQNATPELQATKKQTKRTQDFNQEVNL